MTAEPGPDTSAPPSSASVEEVPWRQLHHLTAVLYGVYGLGVALAGLVPSVIGMAGDDVPGIWLFVAAGGALLVAGVVALFGLVTWLKTRYRVTAERVDKRSGVLFRSFTSIPRDRVRSADLTANPIYQILGLSKVTVGTGQHAGSEQLVLDPVGRVEAERLRQVLLRRGEAARPATTAEETASSGHAGVGVDGDTDVAIGVSDGQLLARLNWSWVRYAPLSAWTVLIGVLPFGLLLQGANWVGVGLVEEAVDRQAWQLFASMAWSLAVTVPLGVLVIGIVGITAVFVEGWWNFRLEREPDGTLRVRRGLLTTRSISLEERRLRGVDVSQPLLVRMAGAAQVSAVATGLGTAADGPSAQRGTLLPSVPRDEADRVAARVVRVDETASPTSGVRLRSHPRVALRRRFVWLLTPTVVAIVALAVAVQLIGWLPGWVWLPALLALPVAGGFAVDAYRNLGHGLSGRFLVTRYGSAKRHTVALQRSGVIGWTVRQTFFQRRAGIATFGATTAAGGGAYLIRDAEMADGLAFADDAVPSLLTEFLERDD